jgi:dTDP-4-amino-4,6-dideoxygalactose transaminase
VKHVCLFANGTLALLTALQALRVTGEVITTPLFFRGNVAYAAMEWLNASFADIDPHTYNINPDRVEELITPNTTAIMPVHCYGIPCDVDRIQKLLTFMG